MSCSRCRGSGPPHHSSSRAGRPRTSVRCSGNCGATRRRPGAGSGAQGRRHEVEEHEVEEKRRHPGAGSPEAERPVAELLGTAATEGRRRTRGTRPGRAPAVFPAAAVEGRGDHRAPGRAGHGRDDRAATERRRHQLEHPRPDQLIRSGPRLRRAHPGEEVVLGHVDRADPALSQAVLVDRMDVAQDLRRQAEPEGRRRGRPGWRAP